MVPTKNIFLPLSVAIEQTKVLGYWSHGCQGVSTKKTQSNQNQTARERLHRLTKRKDQYEADEIYMGQIKGMFKRRYISM